MNETPKTPTTEEGSTPPEHTTLLIVDDSSFPLRTFKRAASMGGITAVTASNVSEAYTALVEIGERLAGVFTDMEMPGRYDGLKVADIALAMGVPAEAIVLNSGSEQNENITAFLELNPGVTFVTKLDFASGGIGEKMTAMVARMRAAWNRPEECDPETTA
ncbi:hypothetical protein CO046_05025 [Candidatus Peregrinibacteria bacterium CG_4_9_14_0_2_um_filter_53_11]|nr:MAG: hypothetical protein CO046_05025 [Candidatus Peregrinibacteria bacterium CG_4_9_14_0_2_um_filter_53_11]